MRDVAATTDSERGALMGGSLCRSRRRLVTQKREKKCAKRYFTGLAFVITKNEVHRESPWY
jgi:hypothetical protein